MLVCWSTVLCCRSSVHLSCEWWMYTSFKSKRAGCEASPLPWGRGFDSPCKPEKPSLFFIFYGTSRPLSSLLLTLGWSLAGYVNFVLSDKRICGVSIVNYAVQTESLPILKTQPSFRSGFSLAYPCRHFFFFRAALSSFLFLGRVAPSLLHATNAGLFHTFEGACKPATWHYEGYHMSGDGVKGTRSSWVKCAAVRISSDLGIPSPIAAASTDSSACFFFSFFVCCRYARPRWPDQLAR